MPRQAPYLLRWSSARQCYELCESGDQTILDLEVESSAWFAWVSQISASLSPTEKVFEMGKRLIGGK